MFEKSLCYRAAFDRELRYAQSRCSKISLIKVSEWSTNLDLWSDFRISTCSVVSKGQHESFQVLYRIRLVFMSVCMIGILCLESSKAIGS